MLIANNLTYRTRQGRYILDNYSFTLEAGERVALLGPSGYGKSTLAQLLAGYDVPESGTITLDGHPVPQTGYRPIQLIYQHPERALNPLWKVRRSLAEAWDVPDSLLDEFGIERSWLDRWPNELSGGQLQRISIVRALHPTTKVLLADEITTSLDPITQVQIWDALTRYLDRHQVSLLLITHNRDLAARICTRTLSIEHERRNPHKG